MPWTGTVFAGRSWTGSLEVFEVGIGRPTATRLSQEEMR